MSQSLNLLSAKEPMTFQALQATTALGPNSVEYIPTGDEEEALRYDELRGGLDEHDDDELDEFESAAFRQQFP